MSRSRLRTTTDNHALLRRPAEPTPAPTGNMRHDSIRLHVDAQRGGSCDNDAGGHWDPPALSGGSGPVRCREQVLQGGDTGGDILRGHRRDEHSHWDRCELDIGWDVEELFSRGEAHQLQHLVLSRVPSGLVDILGFVGYTLLLVLPKEFRPRSLCLSGQS